jgi:hypothetical protein
MPVFMHKMETRRLTNSDMKKLVRIFIGWPTAASESREVKYRKYTKEDIDALPRRLRSSHLSLSSTNLCSMHKGLDAHLVNDVWAWLRHEFDGAIGKFLYPIIMSGRLTAEQELKVRQLEPVIQMWHADFSLEASAPLGHHPINGNSRWKYQKDQCPGCMLARIGSDEKVLFALFAAMVGHFNTRSLSTADMLRSVVGWEKTKSKRIRFVRYWIQASKGRDARLFEAGELGMEMKRLRREWKIELRRLRHAERERPSVDGSTASRRVNDARSERPSVEESTASQTSTGLSGSTACGTSTNLSGTTACNSSDAIRVDISEPYQPKDWSTQSWHDKVDISEPYQQKDWSAQTWHDNKLGPMPRPIDAERHSPAVKLGFNMPGMLDRIRKVHDDTPVYIRQDSNQSKSTVHPGSSVSVARGSLYPPPLRPRKPLPTKVATQPQERLPTFVIDHREDSVMNGQREPSHYKRPPKPYEPSMISTILSYDGAGAHTGLSRGSVEDPLDSSAYNRIETQEERIQRYRDLLAKHQSAYADPFEYDDPNSLPTPKRQSMYSSFGTGPFEDFFATVDEEVEEGDEHGGDHGHLETPDTPKAARRLSVASTAWDNMY